MDATDALERTRGNKPANDHQTKDDGDLYLPPELDGVHAILKTSSFL